MATSQVRLIYLSNARIPSEKANVYQSMQQCSAFSQYFTVEFWNAHRKNPLKVPNVFEYFGVLPTFKIDPVVSLDSNVLRNVHPRLRFYLQATTFILFSILRLIFRRDVDIVYTRHSLGLWAIPFLRLLRPFLPIVYEDHDYFLNKLVWLKKILLSFTNGIVVTSTLKEEAFVKEGISPEKLLAVQNGVDIDRFIIEAEPVCEDGLWHVYYVGNLFERKGVYTLVEAVGLLPTRYILHVVGGSEETMAPFTEYIKGKKMNGNVRVHGYIEPTKIPEVMSHAHVLVLPNSGKNMLSEKFTSPLKMFEYMATGRPIVATEVVAIQEVLKHEYNAFLVKPDNPQALADGIQAVCEDQQRARLLGENAKRDVLNFTWNARTKKIVSFMSKLSLI